MYRICIALLCIVRSYCVRRFGKNWYNAWVDMIGDAKCVRPPPPPSPVLLVKTKLVSTWPAHVFKMQSQAALLQAILDQTEFNLFDFEDVLAAICCEIDNMQEHKDQLDLEYPTKRSITPLRVLYDKYCSTHFGNA